MVFYRAISKIDGPSGSIKWSVHDTPLDAYKKYLTPSKVYTCRLLYNGLMDRLNDGDSVIRITHNEDDNECIWVEVISDPGLPLPISILPNLKCPHC